VISLNYSKQPSWEFGIICHEISCGGVHPFGNYPIDVFTPLPSSTPEMASRAPAKIPNLVVPPLNANFLVLCGFSVQFITIVSDLLECNPKKRTEIKEANTELRNCLPWKMS